MSEIILIVEDEEKIALVLADYLHQAGFETHCLVDGMEVVQWIQSHQPKLILLDLMLPGRSGLEICKEVRSFSTIPIIMTTAKVEEIDRLLGLELGADDYICKPFSPREVVARVKTVLRRSGGVIPQTNGLILDESRFRATLHGKELELTSVEFTLLNLLASNPGRIYRRQHLMDHIYPDQRIVCDRTIDSHIKKLRKKIAVAANPGEEFIQSLYGAGYKFE
ncbi:MAG: response regulator [Desulfuromonadaceae bacterium]|nr:response regulator [Desulfuromonadaceae bacterium]MDD5107235.1 response regulator [Desulfuromonadaceae bacterium]